LGRSVVRTSRFAGVKDEIRRLPIAPFAIAQADRGVVLRAV